MRDYLVRGISRDGTLRGAVACSTALVEETRRRHQTDPTASVALGRLTTATALLGCLLKGDQRLGLMIEANGPLQKLFAETDAHGNIRSSIKNPVAGLPPKDGRFDIVGAVGNAGLLHVTKDLGLKDPYRGSVILVSSEIGEDIAYYLTTSEQVPSSVALGVILGGEGEVTAAGGFLIQALPGASDDAIGMIEETLKSLPPVASLVRDGAPPEEIFRRIFAGCDPTIQATTDLRFRCNCSREQLHTLLLGMSEEDRRHACGTDGAATVVCEFCKEAYRFDCRDLELPPNHQGASNDA